MSQLIEDGVASVNPTTPAGPAGSGRRSRPTVDRASREASRALGFRQPDWTMRAEALPAMGLLSEESVELIHRTSLRILEEIGVDLLSAEARELARRHGAVVRDGDERVRLPADLVEASIAQAPSQFVIRGGSRARDLALGGPLVHFGTVASAPNCSGNGAGRRPGRFEDFRALVQLGHSLNIIHFFGGYPVEPLDIPAPVRHLDCLRELIVLTDKVFHPYCLGRTRIHDAIQMVKIARGIDDAELRRQPYTWTVVNSSSPLRFEGAMLEGMLEMARYRQPVCITPFTLAGAMAPVTLAGALAQQNAEALAGIALLQMAEPGTPVIYGAYTSNVDMRSGSPAMGTPEYFRCTLASGQLARRYRLPFRSSGGNAANAADGQAVYETSLSLWGAKLAHANMVMHAAGWLESGLCASFEKMVIDAEILQNLSECNQPIPVNEDTLAFEAIREVGPGGHFFGSAHTLSRYETIFYEPLLSDWRNHGAWSADGAKDTLQRASERVQALLASYQPPHSDPAMVEALDAFVARRKAEGGAGEL